MTAVASHRLAARTQHTMAAHQVPILESPAVGRLAIALLNQLLRIAHQGIGTAASHTTVRA